MKQIQKKTFNQLIGLLFLNVILFLTSLTLNLYQYAKYRTDCKDYKICKRKQKTSKEIISYLEEELENVNYIAEMRMCQIEELQDSLFKYEDKITATVYNAKANQCNADYSHTATNFSIDTLNPIKHKIMAVSRDLLPKFAFGSKVLVTGTSYDGVWQVQDLMNEKYSNRIDLLINNNMPIGKWENIIIKKVK